MPDILEKRSFASLGAVERLPSPRGVALQLLQLAKREDVTNAEIVRVLQADPALVARLVRAANAQVGGSRRPVVAIGDALLVLGHLAARTLVLGFSLVAEHRDGACAGFDYTGFWTRSLLRGLTARAIAARCRAAAPDEVLACGLLAEIGRLALATLFPAQYTELLARAPALRGAELVHAEQDALGIDHMEVAGAMLAEWGLPAPFLAALASRHDVEKAGLPEGSRNIALARAFALADALVELADAAPEQRRVRYPRLLFIAAKLGIDGDALEQAFDEAVAEWRTWGSMLELPTVPLADVFAHGTASTAAPALAPTDGLALRVLVALGDAAAAAALSHMVFAEGYGAEAVAAHALLERSLVARPHVVLIGADLGGGEVAALLRALRDSAPTREAQLFVVLAPDGEADAAACFDAGADDCLLQPLRRAALGARLRGAQRRARQQEAMARDLGEIRRFASELALDNRKLQEAALTDPLTGLPNRRYAMERMNREWAIAQRRHGRVACMIVDIDHFKLVNDTHGHDVGDDILRHVASLLRGMSRLQDVVCRLGGEEFLVICPDTAPADVGNVAERLRRAVAEIPLPGAPAAVTVSIGAAGLGSAVDSTAALLRLADQALYEAKRAGRNRVVSAAG
jgi:diguanylate cyclase (GGDEF)-like protein